MKTNLKTGTVLPYVIDNRRHLLADVLRDLLSGHGGLSLDVASAYGSSDLDLEIEQLRVAPKSFMVENTLEQAHLGKEYGVIVLAVQRVNGVMQFNPPADLRIESGDVLIAMGERTKLKRLEAAITA